MLKLSGLKTYLTAVIAVLTALIALFMGEISLAQAATAIGLATGLWGARAVTHATEILTIVKDPSRMALTPNVRQYITYAGVGVAALSAVLGAMNDQMSFIEAIFAGFTAAGINFLSVGSKTAAEAVATSTG